ncbi:MAG: hypothetical protein V4489_06585 [Chlamydiota bacterium]
MSKITSQSPQTVNQEPVQKSPEISELEEKTTKVFDSEKKEREELFLRLQGLKDSHYRDQVGDCWSKRQKLPGKKEVFDTVENPYFS